MTRSNGWMEFGDPGKGWKSVTKRLFWPPVAVSRGQMGTHDAEQLTVIIMFST